MEKLTEFKALQVEFLSELKTQANIPRNIAGLDYADILAGVCCEYTVRMADAFEGVQEEGNNGGEYVNMFQKSTGALNAPWCMSFLVYIVNEGIGKALKNAFELDSCEIIPATASTQNFYAWASKYECLTVEPYRGAFSMWRNGKTWTGHVGLVRKIIDTKFMSTVEGNTGPSQKVNRDGDGVYVKTRSYTKVGEMTNKLWLRGFVDMRKIYRGFILSLQLQNAYS